ncbi:MtrB/PioB family decaheme-associated outer membrane protein [Neiella sp. HB171785]|uniref:MtrB/PioB family decaheme-associated outer membrane protein n=1 Tax=Neiella litorisoli TaxID=2771431 RepID=A0A8J6QVB6_9GAMM|nr:MtrB/PioB family decaheme-associated outer membrane protein [Neiella litorisoli]MBD1390268.1 MtrB/PioB family decaheme-associated outer membrane protein [Neiella litorisoli]
MKFKLSFLCCAVAGSLNASEQPDDPFAFYNLTDYRSVQTRQLVDYSGYFELGAGYISESNEQFGQYNGLDEDGVFAIGSGVWRNWQVEDYWFDYYSVKANDLGLDTLSLNFTIGAVQNFKLAVNWQQLRSRGPSSGKTPFRYEQGALTLPENWQAANNASELASLNQQEIDRRFSQVVQRDQLTIDFHHDIDEAWRLRSSVKHEKRDGTRATGAAFFANAQNGHSAILPAKLDSTTKTFEAGVGYYQPNYAADVSYLYSEFENDDYALRWQNPYSANLGPGVAYDTGIGQIATEPDNDMHQFRLTGFYQLNDQWRINADASYAVANQDTALLPYTSNLALPTTALPDRSFDGEVSTTTAKAQVIYRATNKLKFQAGYRYEDRDNDSPRWAWQSVTGDSWAPQDEKYQVYNAPHSRSLQHLQLEGSYRLPKSTRLSASYAYEEIDRYNHAVETTEEDIFELRVNSRPMVGLNVRAQLQYKDRGASTYQWDQSFYSLYDTALINEIPDSQRYSNHPRLSQHYLSNREQWHSQLHLGYVFNARWHMTFDGHYQDSDYDATELGLANEKLWHANLAANWYTHERLTQTFYVAFDRYEYELWGRAFTGGAEKNAFEIYPPLPQASDARRDWTIEPEDTSVTLGTSGEWISESKLLELDWQYQLTLSDSEHSNLANGGAADLSAIALPDINQDQHHVDVSALYHFRDDLSLKLNYQYFRYSTDDWAYANVGVGSIDKVLGSGQHNTNEQVHLVGLSVIYRLP